MSRAEAAAAIVKRFPDAKQKVFETLRQAQEALGNQVVPIEGIATTDKTIAKLTSEFRPDNFRQRMIDILTEAYERKGDVAAANKAIAAADALMNHPIVVIRGTDQLRAFGYRAAYLRGAGVAAEELDDLIGRSRVSAASYWRALGHRTVIRSPAGSPHAPALHVFGYSPRIKCSAPNRYADGIGSGRDLLFGSGRA